MWYNIWLVVVTALKNTKDKTAVLLVTYYKQYLFLDKAFGTVENSKSSAGKMGFNSGASL